MRALRVQRDRARRRGRRQVLLQRSLRACRRRESLVELAEPELKPILITAYDTGRRKGEILNLRWSQVDLRIGAIKLSAEDTKTNFRGRSTSRRASSRS